MRSRYGKPETRRKWIFFQLGILTLMAANAALVGVGYGLARIGAPNPAILALLMVGAVGLLYYVAPAVAIKFHKWGESE